MVNLTNAEILIDRINDMDVSRMVMREYDSAMIGLTPDYNAVYSADGIQKILMERDGMSAEDAGEWISYNIEPLCAYEGGFVLVWGP
jgi:hypothetical protein